MQKISMSTMFYLDKDFSEGMLKNVILKKKPATFFTIAITLQIYLQIRLCEDFT